MWRVLVWVVCAWGNGFAFPHTCHLTLQFAGDIMLGRGVALANSKQMDRTLQLDSLLREGDLNVANLESPLTHAPFVGATYDLRANPTARIALKGFHALSVENNHALDGGVKGKMDTRRALIAAKIQPLSGLWTTKVKGCTTNVWAWTDTEDQMAQPAVPALKKDQLNIAYVHWGSEYAGVTSRQRKLAQQLSQKGFDFVIGSGPHVLQPIERLGETWVAYSLGNLAFDQRMPLTRIGAVLRVNIVNGNVYLKAFATRIDRGKTRLDPSGTSQVYRLLGLP